MTDQMRFNTDKVRGYTRVNLTAIADDRPAGIDCYTSPGSWVPLWVQRTWLRLRRLVGML